MSTGTSQMETVISSGQLLQLLQQTFGAKVELYHPNKLGEVA
jgi:hypothetical protein